MVVGDSVSQGAGGDYTWRYRLAESLRQAPGTEVDFLGPRRSLHNAVTNVLDGSTFYTEPGFDQDHDALWGRTLTGHAPQLPGIINALPAKPDVVIVALGTNDWRAGAAKATTAMRSLVSGVRQAAPGASLVLVKPYVSYSFKSKSYLNSAYTADLGTRIDTLAAELDQPSARIVTSDLRTGFDAAKNTWDGAHPTPTGEIKIARTIASTLQSLGVGDGYHGANDASWPAAGPEPSIKPGAAGRLVVTWTDSTPGALAYALEQRRTTAAGATGDWTRIGAIVRTTRTWTSPVLVAGDSYDYRLRPVRGVMEGVTGSQASATIAGLPTGTTPTAPAPAPYKRPWWQWW